MIILTDMVLYVMGVFSLVGIILCGAGLVVLINGAFHYIDLGEKNDGIFYLVSGLTILLMSAIMIGCVLSNIVAVVTSLMLKVNCGFILLVKLINKT